MSSKIIKPCNILVTKTDNLYTPFAEFSQNKHVKANGNSTEIHEIHNFEQTTFDYFPAFKIRVNLVKEEILSKSLYVSESPEQSDSRKLKPSVASKKCLVQDTNCIIERIYPKRKSSVVKVKNFPKMSSCATSISNEITYNSSNDVHAKFVQNAKKHLPKKCKKKMCRRRKLQNSFKTVRVKYASKFVSRKTSPVKFFIRVPCRHQGDAPIVQLLRHEYLNSILAQHTTFRAIAHENFLHIQKTDGTVFHSPRKKAPDISLPFRFVFQIFLFDLFFFILAC